MMWMMIMLLRCPCRLVWRCVVKWRDERTMKRMFRFAIAIRHHPQRLVLPPIHPSLYKLPVAPCRSVQNLIHRILWRIRSSVPDLAGCRLSCETGTATEKEFPGGVCCHKIRNMACVVHGMPVCVLLLLFLLLLRGRWGMVVESGSRCRGDWLTD